MERRIVIVDDEPIARFDTAEMLSELGFVVVGQGATGSAGIDLCRKHQPDIVLMDIEMPILDGLESARIIIREKLCPCILMITAFYDMEFIQKAKEIGVCGYIVKPINEKMLSPAIELALEQSKTRQSLERLEKQGQEKKVIDMAMHYFAKEKNITKDEAYLMVQKASMEKNTSMLVLAKVIIKNYQNKSYVNKAKVVMMKGEKISERMAFQKLKQEALKKNISMEEYAKNYLEGRMN